MNNIDITNWKYVIVCIFLFIQCTNESDFVNYNKLNINDAEYLDIENDCFAEFTEDDWRNFIDAKERLTVFMLRNHCSEFQEQYGKIINISEKLLSHLMRCIDNSNRILTLSNKIPIVRTKSENPEPGVPSYIGNNCVAYAISHYGGPDIDYIDSILCRYPHYRNGAGILMDDIVAVVRLFLPGACEQSSFWNQNFIGDKNIAGIIVINGHAMNAVKIHYYYWNNYYEVFCCDYQPGGLGDCSINIKSNELPAYSSEQNHQGTIAIWKYIK